MVHRGEAFVTYEHVSCFWTEHWTSIEGLSVRTKRCAVANWPGRTLTHTLTHQPGARERTGMGTCIVEAVSPPPPPLEEKAELN